METNVYRLFVICVPLWRYWTLWLHWRQEGPLCARRFISVGIRMQQWKIGLFCRAPHQHWKVPQKISEAKRCSFNLPAIGRRVPTIWTLSYTRFPPVKRGFFLPLMLVEACWETGCADCEGCQRQAGPVGHGGDLTALDVGWPFPLGPASCWSCQYKHSPFCSFSQSPLPTPTPKLMARQRSLCVSWPNTDSDFNINQCWQSKSSVWSCVYWIPELLKVFDHIGINKL